MTATFSRFYLSALDERISVEVIHFQTCNTSAFKQVLAFPLKKLVEQLRLLGYIHICIAIPVKKSMLVLIYRFSFRYLYHNNGIAFISIPSICANFIRVSANDVPL